MAVTLRQNREGVTLIELVVVMVIIGLMVVFAAPELSRTIKNSRVKDCALRLVSDIKLARTKAQAEGQRAMVVVTKDTPHDFNSDGSSEHYLIFLDADRGSDFDAGEDIIAEVACNGKVEMETVSNPLPQCANFTDGRCMRFTTLGTLASDATDKSILIGYSNYSKYKVKITLVSITGHLRVQFSNDGGTTYHDL